MVLLIQKGISIHHSPDTMIFEAEFFAISLADLILSSAFDQSIVIITHSLAFLQCNALPNPELFTKTKYGFLNQLNTPQVHVK